MMRSAIAALVVICLGYVLLHAPETTAQNGQYVQTEVVKVPTEEKRTVREDGSVIICTETGCRFEPAPQMTQQVVSQPVYSQPVYSQPVYTSTSYGSNGTSYPATSYGSAGGATYYATSSPQASYGCAGTTRAPVRRIVGGTLRTTARVATAPVRFVRNRQPVRSLLRRVFCR